MLKSEQQKFSAWQHVWPVEIVRRCEICIHISHAVPAFAGKRPATLSQFIAEAGL